MLICKVMIGFECHENWHFVQDWTIASTEGCILNWRITWRQKYFSFSSISSELWTLDSWRRIGNPLVDVRSNLKWTGGQLTISHYDWEPCTCLAKRVSCIRAQHKHSRTFQMNANSRGWHTHVGGYTWCFGHALPFLFCILCCLIYLTCRCLLGG